jgi:thermitase
MKKRTKFAELFMIVLLTVAMMGAQAFPSSVFEQQNVQAATNAKTQVSAKSDTIVTTDSTNRKSQREKDKVESKKALEKLDNLKPGVEYVKDEIIVRANSIAEAKDTAQLYGGTVKSYSKQGYAVLKLAGNGELFRALTKATGTGNGYPAAFPNYVYNMGGTYKPSYFSSDPEYSQQYFHNDMNNKRAWNITKGQSGIVVAVLDTGIDVSHPEFVGKLDARAYNAANKSVGLGQVEDMVGHGTHVAGIIAALQNNGTGGCGTAPGVTLLPIKMTEVDSETFTTAALLEGIYYAANAGAEIINLSAGRDFSGGSSLLEREAILYASEKGCLMVTAAGNQLNGHADYPAAYPECVAVSALASGNVFDDTYSNHGPEIDLSAPGSLIYSTYLNNGYATMSGTSMATPNVSAAAALVLSENPELNSGDVCQILYSTAVDKGSWGRDDYYGAGAVNTYNALAVMQSTPFAVTFDSQGGSAVKSRVAYTGTALLVPDEPWRHGYAFNGWYKDPLLQNPWMFGQDTADSNLTLYAGWAPEGNASVEAAPVTTMETVIEASIDFPGDRDYYLFTPTTSMRYFFEYTGPVRMDAWICSYSQDENTLDGLRIPQLKQSDGDGNYTVTGDLTAGKTYVLCIDGKGASLGAYNLYMNKGYDITLNLNSPETIQTFTFPAYEGESVLDSVDFTGIRIQRSGYVFGGWSITTTGGTEWNLENAPVNKNLTLYARWVKGTDFASGSGTIDDPYHIGTKYQLSLVDFFPTSNFVLDRDLTFTASDFSPGGPYYNDGEGWKPLCIVDGFQGTFFGNGHTISGLKIDKWSDTEAQPVYAGLFGSVYSGTIQDLGIINCDIHAASLYHTTYAGAIAGQVVGGTIANCYNTGSIDTAGYYLAYAGGIVGFCAGGSMHHCTNFGSVKAEGAEECAPNCSAGGISGEISQSKVTLCDNIGAIFSQTTSTKYGYGEAKAGGITGHYSDGGTGGDGSLSYLRGCVNKGSVQSIVTTVPDGIQATYSFGGGIAGVCDGLIDKCTNDGAVYGANNWMAVYSGGIAGSTQSGICRYCVNAGTVKSEFLNPDASIMGYLDTGGITGDLINQVGALDSCFNTGLVTETNPLDNSPGAIAGDTVSNPNISACYFLNNMDRGIGAQDSQLATSLTESQMRQKTSFVGFDFTNTWQIGVNSKYPYPEIRGIRNLIPYVGLAEVNLSGNGVNQVVGIDAAGFVQTPSSPTKTGARFNRWYQDAACTIPWNFVTGKASGLLTLYAGWTPNKYTVYFYPSEGTGTMSSQVMEYGVPEKLNLCTFKNIGVPFRYWEGEDMGGFYNGQVVENLTAVNGGSYKMYAAWGAVIQTVVSAGYNSLTAGWVGVDGAGSYVISRSTSMNSGYIKVGTASSSARAWTNTGLVTGKTYYYRVFPVISGKTYSNNDSVGGKPIPASPSVTASKASSTSIKVAWGAVAGATKYQVYRSTSLTGTYQLVYTGSATSRSWTNTGLASGSYYYYKVRACHLEGTLYINGSFSGARYYYI